MDWGPRLMWTFVKLIQFPCYCTFIDKFWVQTLVTSICFKNRSLSKLYSCTLRKFADSKRKSIDRSENVQCLLGKNVDFIPISLRQVVALRLSSERRCSKALLAREHIE